MRQVNSARRIVSTLADFRVLIAGRRVRQEVAGSSPVAPALSLFLLHCPGKLGRFGSLTADADLHTDELGIGASGCEPKILFQMNEPSTAQAKAHIEPPEKPSMHDGLSECDTNREMKVSS